MPFGAFRSREREVGERKGERGGEIGGRGGRERGRERKGDRGGERGGRETKGERRREREGEREGGERGGREGGERGGERERGRERKFIFIYHFFRSIQLAYGGTFKFLFLPQLQDRGSSLFRIIYMKKLLSSDWLRQMQFSGNSV